MALEGYLEDLGLCDILQILSLSKKSGTLTLKSQKGEGLVCFLNGEVVRASSTFFPDTLGLLLRKKKIVTEAQVDIALEYQKSINYYQPLGQILIDKFKISSAEIETVVAVQIEKIIFSFFSWGEGHFSFQLEEMKSFGSALLNPLDFMLAKGLSSQRLVLKGQKVSSASGCGDNVDAADIETELVQLKKHHDQQGLELLRGMLAELEHPEYGGGIILLILRYASEIMNRAIVFDVRGNQLVGVGQFGLDKLNISADEMVRNLRLQVDPDSLFSNVLSEKSAVCGTLKKTVAEEQLKDFLNGTPQEVFLGPLVSDGSVVALLYGDNFPDNNPINSANAFEIFLSQAGVAMEQAILTN